MTRTMTAILAAALAIAMYVFLAAHAVEAGATVIRPEFGTPKYVLSTKTKANVPDVVKVRTSCQAEDAWGGVDLAKYVVRDDGRIVVTLRCVAF